MNNLLRNYLVESGRSLGYPRRGLGRNRSAEGASPAVEGVKPPKGSRNHPGALLAETEQVARRAGV